MRNPRDVRTDEGRDRMLNFKRKIYHISVDRLPAVHASHYFLLSNEIMQGGILAIDVNQKKPFLGNWVCEQPYTKGDGFFVHSTCYES